MKKVISVDDFDKWNTKKKMLTSKKITQPFQERQIWWCSLGLNIGDEQNGKNSFYERPVLVVKKFNSTLCWILPLTSKQKSNPYYYNITADTNKYAIILSQLRLVSTKRFQRYLRKLPKKQFNLVKCKLIDYLK